MKRIDIQDRLIQAGKARLAQARAANKAKVRVNNVRVAHFSMTSFIEGGLLVYDILLDDYRKKKSGPTD